MNTSKRWVFRLLPWLFALLLLIPLKMVQQRNLDRALLSALDADVTKEGDALPLVEALLRKGAGHDAQADLFIGILRRSAAQVETALGRGAKVNAVFAYRLPLVYAIGRQRPDVLRVLLTHGADVNAVEARGTDTPLIQAVQHHDLEAVKLLLAAGAKVNATGADGNTALDQDYGTTEGKNGTILRLLLEAGAKSFVMPKLRQQLLAGETPDPLPEGAPPS